MSERPNFIIAGTGVAGLSAARECAQLGGRVLLIDQRPTRDDRPVGDDKSLFIDAARLPIEVVEGLGHYGALTPVPELSIYTVENPDDTRVETTGVGGIIPPTRTTYGLDHPLAIDYFYDKIPDEVQLLGSTRIASSHEDNGRVMVRVATNGQFRDLEAEYLIDASGDFSSVSRHHQTPEGAKLLDDDPYILNIRGMRAQGSFTPGVLLMPMGREIGFTWVLPYSQDCGDVIVSDFCRMSELGDKVKRQKLQGMLDNFVSYGQNTDLFNISQEIQRFAGVIRVQPIPRSATSRTNHVYQVGSSAGMGAPYSGEVIPAAYRWGSHVAQAIDEGSSPEDFFNRWRFDDPMFNYHADLAALRLRIKRGEKGVYGGSMPFLQSLLTHLPKEAINSLYYKRTIAPQFWPHALRAVFAQPSSMRLLGQFGLEYFKVSNRKGEV